MTLADAIVEVRRLLQDNNAPVRYSDALLIGFGNQALKRIAVLRPELFALIAEYSTVAGQVLQTMPSDSLRIMEIFQVKDGGGIVEVNRKAMEESYPSWSSDPAGPCVNWMRHVRNANRFFIYPKAPQGQVLIVEYSQVPKTYLIDEEIELLPEAYLPVLVDGMVFLAESVDNEHVNSNRAQLFQQSFTQSLGVGIQSRIVTDTDEGGLPSDQVV